MKKFIRALNYGPTLKGVFQIVVLIICVCISLCLKNICPDTSDVVYYIVIVVTALICLFVLLSDSVPSIKKGMRMSELHDSQDCYISEE